uniref:USP domain-containing protein n=1 Tax=Oryza brachyantha TaxID=4533 RepID=J3N9L7_ORYBR
MAKIGGLISSFFIMLNKKTYILFRIEFLVVVATMLFLGMSILDIFRRRFHNSLIKSIFNLSDAVSDSIVLYILGAMQTAPIKNQLFPVWAIVLILRSFYRFILRNLAAQSIWLGQSSSLVSEYMRADGDLCNFKLEDCDPETMKGYRYLVYGETKSSVKLQKPRYALYIDSSRRRKRHGRRYTERKYTTNTDRLTTLDKIWQCDGNLLQSDDKNAKRLKDLSLAFALSRLLRCRFQGVELHTETLRINKKLIKRRIIQEDADRAFRIMELQLSFVHDYFNTRYPMVFWCGFPSLFFSFILSAMTFAVAFWLSVDIRKVTKPPEGDTAHSVHGINVDTIITWFFMGFMMFKEIWEMVTYLLSDWTRLLLTCLYERWRGRCMRTNCTEKLILSFFKSKITERWHGVIDQYVFLQSYDGSPTFWNLLHKLTMGAVAEKDEGAELGNPISIPECVKPEILKKLVSQDLTHNYLCKVIISLPDSDSERVDRYSWACSGLPTCSHIILVWHIATSICEMHLAKHEGVNLRKPGFLSGLLSCLTNCCSSKSYIMDEKKLPGDLQKSYTVANSISRYCAYLLVSKPDLIPDSFLVPKMVFQETVRRARDDVLKDCDSLLKRYDKLIEEGKKAIQDKNTVMNGEDVMQQGAMLGKLLIDNESKERCWELLAGLWADLLVHIAPTWNAEAHQKYLGSGGEFITHIWALLWNCGIEKSILWPEDDASINSPPAAPDDNNSGRQTRNEDNQVLPTTATIDGGLADGNVFRGMRNLGNTCYLNAVLQSLLALDKLRATMLGSYSPEDPLEQELKKLFMETRTSSHMAAPLDTEQIFSCVCSLNPDLKPGVMEDSNIVLGLLVDRLNNQELVGPLFRGQVTKHVSCTDCEHTSVTTENLVLSLAIPPGDAVSIENCLNSHVNGKTENWHCTNCSATPGNAKTIWDNQSEGSDSEAQQKEKSSHSSDEQPSTQNQDNGNVALEEDKHQNDLIDNKPKVEMGGITSATIKYRITKAPPVLTIQLKRFDYVCGNRSQKLGIHVSFAETIDITNFIDPKY